MSTSGMNEHAVQCCALSVDRRSTRIHEDLVPGFISGLLPGLWILRSAATRVSDVVVYVRVSCSPSRAYMALLKAINFVACCSKAPNAGRGFGCSLAQAHPTQDYIQEETMRGWQNSRSSFISSILVQLAELGMKPVFYPSRAHCCTHARPVRYVSLSRAGV